MEFMFYKPQYVFDGVHVLQTTCQLYKEVLLYQ